MPQVWFQSRIDGSVAALDRRDVFRNDTVLDHIGLPKAPVVREGVPELQQHVGGRLQVAGFAQEGALVELELLPQPAPLVLIAVGEGVGLTPARVVFRVFVVGGLPSSFHELLDIGFLFGLPSGWGKHADTLACFLTSSYFKCSVQLSLCNSNVLWQAV